MRPKDFSENAAGRLVRAEHNGRAYWAFVPHPLPPPIEWDLALTRALSEADRALGELSGLGRNLANPQLLIQPFLRREAVLSSRIEGTETDLPDLYAYEAGQLPLPGVAGRPAPSESDVREVANYVRALEYGLERVASLPVSLRLIRELHRILMEGVRGDSARPGEFRRGQVYLPGAAGQDVVTAEFVPPPADELPAALDGFERYLHAGDDPYPPLVRLALIHYQFEAIHPFHDGNGRIGRLLLSLLLVEWQLLPLPLLYLSAYLERRRDAYFDCLLAISQRGAWKEWLRFFLAGVTEQSRDAVQRARQLQDLQLEWRDQMVRVRASALALRLVDVLFETPLVTIPYVQERLNITYQGARNIVRKLIQVGFLEQLGEAAYGRTYYAPQILRILQPAGSHDAVEL